MTLKKDVLVIDHISLLLKEEDELRLTNFLVNNLPPIKGSLLKPHLTLAYSPSPISSFPLPNNEFEGEVIYDVPSKYQITLEPSLGYYYEVFTDPYKRDNLVLNLNMQSSVIEKFNYYAQKGAIWVFGEYKPFIILESNTSFTQQEVNAFKMIDFTLSFPYIRFKRFGEYKYVFP